MKLYLCYRVEEAMRKCPELICVHVETIGRIQWCHLSHFLRDFLGSRRECVVLGGRRG
jgi:hypothetical protein